MADEATERTVSAHYTSGGLLETAERALRDAGIEPVGATVEQLASLDHFHSFGVAGTLELARRLEVGPDDRALDVGGGIGGPARLLASRTGCTVAVLDLTPEFCEVGAALSAWTRLTDRVSFVCGSALEMPFADETFTAAWTQHAAMNIADKPRLYAEIHRVLRRGGRFALFDVLAGPNQPMHFPVPWADDPSYSFLLPPDEVRAMITATGFVEREWLEWRELIARLQQAGPSRGAVGTAETGPVPPTVAVLMGPSAQVKIANAWRNTQEGRTTLGLGVFERV